MVKLPKISLTTDSVLPSLSTSKIAGDGYIFLAVEFSGFPATMSNSGLAKRPKSSPSASLSSVFGMATETACSVGGWQR